MLDFNDPIILFIALPLCLSLLGQLLIRFFFGEGVGSTLANSAIVIAFLLTLLVYKIIPFSFGSEASLGEGVLKSLPLAHKIFAIVGLSFLLGLFADKFPRSDKASLYMQLSLLVFSLFWVFITTAPPPLEYDQIKTLAILNVLGIIFFHQNNEAKDTELLAAKNLFSFALGLFGISYLAGFHLINNLLLIYLAATVGYFVINLFKNRFPFGASAIYPSFLLLFLLAMEIYNMNVNLLAPMLLLGATFFTQDILRKYAERFDPLILNLCPVGLALGASYFLI